MKTQGWNAKKVKVFRAAFLDFLKHVQIASKDIEGYQPLQLYDAQKRFLDEVFTGLEQDIRTFVVLKARQLGLCLDPKTRVLTAELEWLPIEEIQIGDELIACDENTSYQGAGRKMQTCRVEATREVSEPAFEVSMDNGAKLVSTADHRFLFKKRGAVDTKWMRVKDARVGDEIKYVTDPWGDSSFEDCWMSGLVDGEGCLRHKKGGVELSVSQVDGAVLNRARKYFAERTYSVREEVDRRKGQETSKLGNKPVYKLVISRTAELFKFMGQCYPTRFQQFRWWEGKELPGKRIGNGYRKIVSIRELPAQRMIDLQTSTKTFIAEGFVSHNSTITRALIVFWAFMNEGLRVALVYDKEINRDAAHLEIKQFLERLPPSHSIPISKHNRNLLEFKNGSTIFYFVAGVTKGKGSGGLGRSVGIACAGCTEMSSWGDIEGLKSFNRSVSQQHPNRLYIWESTARGFNIFHDIWEDAKADDLAKRAIFIGWWAKETYRLPKGTALFQRYGAAEPDAEELKKIALVQERYGHTVDQEQLAWYRHEHDPNIEKQETDKDGADLTAQELPWYEEEAWVMTGASFFPGDELAQAWERAEKTPVKGYRYFMSQEFFGTIVEPVRVPRQAVLRVWEEPDPDGVYVIGADPAYGASELADRHCAQVLRCYADGVDQVAEFCTTTAATYQFAWVLAHLCGAYGNARLLLEINGPGQAVLNGFRELELLVRQGYLQASAQEAGLTNIFASVKHYMYARQDSIQRNPTAFHWVTTTRLKVTILERLRDHFNTGALRVNSVEALREMQTIRREGDEIGGEGSNKDDRVIALALAVRAWEDSARKPLIAARRTRDFETKQRTMTSHDLYNLFMDRQLGSFFDRTQNARLQAARAAKRGTRYNF
jgi:hypothetical protein